MSEGGEGCGSSGFDEGGDVGEATSGYEDSAESSEASSATETTGTETTGIQTSSVSEYGNEGFSGFGKAETSSRGIETVGMNDHIHGRDTKSERYTAKMETVSNESFSVIANQSKRQSYEYAAKMCEDRRDELTAKSKQDATEARLDESKNFSENVIGTHSPYTGEIRVSDIVTERCAEHTLDHEYMHAASYKSKEVTHSEKESVEKMTSGIRENIYTTNYETGTVTPEYRNVSLNEGFTETYTLRSEQEAGIDHGTLATYSTNREYAASLEDLVGEEMVSEAYFNGMSKELADRCNELGKDENTWSDINSLLDKATKYSENETSEMRAERENARKELDSIFERMNINRLEEMKNAERNAAQNN